MEEGNKENKELQEYEKKHINFLRENAAECCLFLKKDDSFPLSSPGKVLLIGSGARETIKGGTGSGNVESRFFTTCEKGLEEAGFEIVSKDWLDNFPKFKKSKKESFINYIKEKAENVKTKAGFYSIGFCQPEAEYDLPLNYEADLAIYVLSRNSGEGQDRQLIKGDIYLTNSEIRDILYLNEKYNKFLLVLNVPGVVDLSPVINVKNILLLSLLGVVTGNILADIIIGKANPSGKLTTTWASVKDYKYIEEFGNIDNTRYLEGIYVGYRYFDSFNVKPFFNFGFGLSYTDFTIKKKKLSNSNDEIVIETEVTNTGKYPGKEVVQVYVSPSQENKDKPYQSLVSFKKTPLLKPNESCNLILNFKMEDIARYDEETAQYILDKGNYLVRVGNCSNKTELYGYIFLNENIFLYQLKNVGGKADFIPLSHIINYDDNLSGIDKIELTKDNYKYIKIDYNYTTKISEKIKDLSDEELGKLCIGNYAEGGKPNIQQVFGEAAETCRSIKGIDKYLVLADGPAGLRIAQKYGVDEKGKYRLSEDPLLKDMLSYIPKEYISRLDIPENNKDRKGKVFYQNSTAIPIGTALAQSFNENLLEKIGANIIGEEMDFFNINLWLAPGMNIHRNILCGRNFEYYSEDPLISGKMAAAITRGVQSHKNRGVAIKHFACNNQETNRLNNNSILTERTLREIYLKGFQIAIKEGVPKSLMTSYNLINGIHSSARRDLIIDVLRCEFQFNGLIMSDWYGTSIYNLKISNYPDQICSDNIKAGNNLQNFGEKNHLDNLMESLKNGKVKREDLLESASIIYETIELLNQ